MPVASGAQKVPPKQCGGTTSSSRNSATSCRLFSFISIIWRAKPLVSYQAITDLISATTTENRLTVRCELDSNTDTTGIVVSDEEMDLVNIARDEFHGEWNATTQPRYDDIGAVNF